MADAEIIARLRLAADQFDRELRESFAGVESEAETAGYRAGEALGRSLRVGAGVAAAAGGILYAGFRQLTEYAQEIDESARATGLAVEQYQVMIGTLGELGVRQEDAREALGNLNRSLREVQQDGASEAAEAFRALGLEGDVLSGRISNAQELIEAITDRQGEMGRSTEDLTNIIRILGEDASPELIAALQITREELEATEERFRETGAVIQQEHIDRIREAEITVDQFVTNTSGWLTIWAADTIASLNSVGGALEAVSQLFRGGGVGTGLSGAFASLNSGFGDAGSSGIVDRIGRAFAPAINRPPAGSTSGGRTGGGGRSGGRSGGGGRSGPSAEERSVERYNAALQDILESLREEERLTAMIADGRTREAEVAEALGDLHRRLPELLVAQTAEQREQLQLLEQMTEQQVLQRIAAEEAATERAKKTEAGEEFEQEQRDFEEEMQQQRQDNLRDLADFYEEAFSGSAGSIWDMFRDLGRRAIAELAAEATLDLFSAGGKGGGGLSSLFGAIGLDPLSALLGGQAAFANGAGNYKSILPSPGAGFSIGGAKGFVAGDSPIGPNGEIIVQGSTGLPSIKPKVDPLGGGQFNLLQGAGIGAAFASLPELLGLKTSTLGGTLGGSVGNYFGGPIGSVIGSFIGSTLFGLFKKTKQGSAIISGVDSPLGFTGNSSERKDAAGGYAGAVQDALGRMADLLDAELGSFLVSIGVRKDSIKVDPSGRGSTKGGGVRDFGQDADAAIAYAISDAIADGAIKGISDAALRILQSGQNLEAAIEKAVLIESIPKLLRERLDPLGAALDEIDAKFRKVAEAMREGSASAEQIAEARQLWQLEREDALREIGAASQTLQDFLQSLAVGSSSPLSLRDQLAVAQGDLAPYLELIRQGATDGKLVGFDQQGYRDAADVVLGLTRDIEGSTLAFFSQFDEIRNFTQTALDLVDASVPALQPARDPFTEATAQKLDSTNDLLAQINATLKAGFGGGGGGSGASGFVGGGLGFLLKSA